MLATQREGKNKVAMMQTLWGELLVEELLRLGLDYFCLAPGSRSTPLVAAVAKNPNAKKTICFDERGAAFHALGYARATNKPAVVIVTSGTAAANLYPAVIEASLDFIPMLVLTADRPPELKETAANQTIRQERLFGNYPRWYFELPVPDENIAPQVLLTTLDQAASLAQESPAGPVHLNCLFREPLEVVAPEGMEDYLEKVSHWRSSDRPLTFYQKKQVSCGPDSLNVLAARMREAGKGLLVIGKLRFDEQRSAVMRLIEEAGWPVYADITSGLRLGAVGTNMIRHFDEPLLSEGFQLEVKPAMVVQIGGRVTSKRYPQFIEEHKPYYVVVKSDPYRYDPAHCVSEHFESDITIFCTQLATALANKALPVLDFSRGKEFKALYDQKASAIQAVIEAKTAAHEKISEPFVAREISRLIPEGSALFLSSSMPVRDMDLYSLSGRGSIAVACNRGASGIDGVIASAAGFAVGKESLTTLLIGDLAFIHDVSSLSILKGVKHPLIMVVVNNRGGGIFHFLPVAKTTDIFEEYFATPHPFSFEGISRSFQLDYHAPKSKQGFVTAYRAALAKGQHAVIEISTDREENFHLRKEIKNAILQLFL